MNNSDARKHINKKKKRNKPFMGSRTYQPLYTSQQPLRSRRVPINYNVRGIEKKITAALAGMALFMTSFYLVASFM